MRKYIFLLLVAVMGFSLHAQSDVKEMMAIKKVIESAYLDGVQNIGDVAKIKAGFHPDFKMQEVGKDGQVRTVSLNELSRRVRYDIADGHLPKRMGEHARLNYQSIVLNHNTASVKMDYVLNGKTLNVKVMHLSKVGDSWKIVNKKNQELNH